MENRSSTRRDFLFGALAGGVIAASGISLCSTEKSSSLLRCSQKPDFPTVTYFVESREEARKIQQEGHMRSRGEWLQQKIATDEATKILVETRSRIAMGLEQGDMDDRALIELLQHFNNSKISIDLWANHWVHAGNINEIREEVIEMINRLEREHIDLEHIGLDVELPMSIMVPHVSLREYFRERPWNFSQTKARDKLTKLIDEILAAGRYGVDTYEIPLLGDHSIPRKLFGIPEVPDIRHPKFKRVAMVYSSVKPSWISSEEFISAYSYEKGRVPALGIVSASGVNPGVDMDFQGMLSGEDLLRDIKTALSGSPCEFYMFALNGIEVIKRVRNAIKTCCSI